MTSQNPWIFALGFSSYDSVLNGRPLRNAWNLAENRTAPDPLEDLAERIGNLASIVEGRGSNRAGFHLVNIRSTKKDILAKVQTQVNPKQVRSLAGGGVGTSEMFLVVEW